MHELEVLSQVSLRLCPESRPVAARLQTSVNMFDKECLKHVEGSTFARSRRDSGGHARTATQLFRAWRLTCNKIAQRCASSTRRREVTTAALHARCLQAVAAQRCVVLLLPQLLLNERADAGPPCCHAFRARCGSVYRDLRDVCVAIFGASSRLSSVSTVPRRGGHPRSAALQCPSRYLRPQGYRRRTAPQGYRRHTAPSYISWKPVSVRGSVAAVAPPTRARPTRTCSQRGVCAQGVHPSTRCLAATRRRQRTHSAIHSLAQAISGMCALARSIPQPRFVCRQPHAIAKGVLCSEMLLGSCGIQRVRTFPVSLQSVDPCQVCWACAGSNRLEPWQI